MQFQNTVAATFIDAQDFCWRLNSTLSLPVTGADFRILRDFLKKQKWSAHYVWLPYTDNEVEGRFIDIYTHQEFTLENWYEIGNTFIFQHKIIFNQMSQTI